MIVANSSVRKWKENIPIEWQIIPLKFVVSYNCEKLPKDTDNNYEFDYVDIGSVKYGKGIESFQHMTFSESPSRARRIVHPNDVILSTVRTYLKASAKINSHDNPVIVSTGFITMRANENKIIPDYLGYIVQSDGLVSEIECQSYGVSYPAINAIEVVNLSIPLPDINTQKVIVSFLDLKCKGIDLAIERHKRNIDKLKEYKNSYITQVITKGLKDLPFSKESDIDWLGTIPYLWQVKKIKYVFTIRKRIAGTNGLTVLSITQNGIVPKDVESNEGQIAESYENYQIVEPGDFAMNHMDLLTGWVDVSKYSGVTSPDYRIFTLNDTKNNDSRYFKYMMQMFYFNKIFYGLGAGISTKGRWRLQAPIFKNFKIPVPPLEEQREIADAIEEKVTKIDSVVAKHTEIIDKLEEYKKSIIYHAVTGKIDCSGGADDE